MKRSLYVLVFAAVAAGSASLGAQARPQPQEVRPQPQDAKSAVPRTHLPPPGMCRIWLDNVPPAQQPAPTDCASAARNLPRNGRLVYSDEPRNTRLPLIKSLTDPPVQPPKKLPDDPAKVITPDRKPAKPDIPEGK